MAKRKNRRNQRARSRPEPRSEPATDTVRDTGDDTGEVSEDAPERRSLTRFEWWRENLEAVIVAFVLALIIRHFSLEAFEIPTGSMAPTLFGIHATTECPNCETSIDIGLQTDEEQKLRIPFERRLVYRGSCPRCGMPSHRAWSRPGHALGEGAAIQCNSGACGHRWTVRASELEEEDVVAVGSSDFLLECPLCQLRYHDVLSRSNVRGGHKILVNKWAFLVGKPERWDVIVFHFDEEKNYIKRLLGLPGETVWIEDGDLYVRGPDDSAPRIARKIDRPDARQSLWIPIADSTVAEKGYNAEPAWREAFEGSARLGPEADSKWWSWNAESLRWTVNALNPRDAVAALRFNRRCENFYCYNLVAEQSGGVVREQVGDKKVTFTVRPSEAHAGGWIGGEIRDGDFSFQLRLPIGDPSSERRAELRRVETDPNPDRPSPNRPVPEAFQDERVEADAALPLNKPSRVEFENVDDRVAVWLDGTEILSLEYVSGTPWSRRRIGPEEHHLLLLASNASADFEAVRVSRDVYYTEEVLGGADPGALTPEGQAIGSVATDGVNEYFPCGDNSPSSSDGRFWGTAPEQNLMGKAFVIFWPALPWNWQCRFIR